MLCDTHPSASPLLLIPFLQLQSARSAFKRDLGVSRYGSEEHPADHGRWVQGGWQGAGRRCCQRNCIRQRRLLSKGPWNTDELLATRRREGGHSRTRATRQHWPAGKPFVGLLGTTSRLGDIPRRFTASSPLRRALHVTDKPQT